MDRTNPSQMKLLSRCIFRIYKADPYLLVPRLLSKMFDVPEKTIVNSMREFKNFPFVKKPTGRINAGNYLLTYLVTSNPNNAIANVELTLDLKDEFIKKSPYYDEWDWKRVEEGYTEDLVSWEKE